MMFDTQVSYIGCCKLQVSFRKRATNYNALLRKETYKDNTFYASLLWGFATLYIFSRL